MRYIILCTLVLAATACQSPAVETLEEAQNWIALDSAEHWRGYKQEGVPDAWVIEDGVLHKAGKGGGDLITREQFESFELELEWKIAPGGNSGIMYHVSEGDGPTYVTGPEMQILDNATFDGNVDLLHAAGADYGLHAPTSDDSRPAGEWNTVRILVAGPHVEYWMNGVQQCSYELWSDDWNARVAGSKFGKWKGFGMNTTGHIALQEHGAEVWFRGVRIRIL